MSSDSVVIVSGARTPMGGFQGDLSGATAPQLGAAAIKAAVERAGVNPAEIDEVIMGCILTAGVKQGPARQAMRNAGIPDSTGAVTINKLCGSGMKAVMQAHDTIKAGSADIVVAGGMESMTNAPYILPQARNGYRMGHNEVKDHMFLDGLEDADTGKLMGQFAQEMADEKGYTREQMDNFAIESLNRALTAINEGHFKDEVTPVTVKTRKGDVVVESDEQPAKANAERIPLLRPAFAKEGSITAANASSISDGAAAVVVTSEKVAQEKGFNIEARIVATASNSRHPSEFTIAPIGAMEKVLAKAGWSVEDVDLWEINEAFAMVTMAAMDELNIPHEKVNIEGGACALGHPVGCSGARILVTLINSLKRTGGKKGVGSLCIGGGEAVAVAIELP
ncbi:thiolase family protein [Psychrobacter sanguinis]|uniref:thiolase family protein n=1 Tax=Psychrobacter sanguinis TaxID=861445 RepID=UPI00020C65D2|nr:thiolase family protein [Psychrobacter sanguinis]EGK08466.1 acetyl-CoA acetyltransferase [Psychrobacter sp. 1501(2011)]MCC3306883.1 thiolase family protein [Psychrobacter sanguinis]MCC3345312.1 thiolase family protein [Psychrobacter sanguinis]MCD9152190.1 thiolase family protein [Psychrobacter sanguinis]MDY3307392.1 thiolase family protein [Psychrobacter sanguinis]